MKTFKELKEHSFFQDYALELEDLRGAKDSDEVVVIKNEYGEYEIELYRENELMPYYTMAL
jgi:hypothetical protein